MHLVKEIVKVKPFELHLLFEDGNVHIVPLEMKLKNWSHNEGSIYKKLLNPDFSMATAFASTALPVFTDT